MVWTIEQIGFAIEDESTAGNIGTVSISTPVGELRIMGELEKVGRCLVATGVHMHGVDVGANSVTPANLRVIAEAFLSEYGYDDLVVQGGIRTTGANPGRQPRALRFTRRSGRSSE